MRAFFLIPLLLPVGVDYRTRRFPVVTFTIMGICAAVHLISIAVWLNGGPEASDEFAYTMGFVKDDLNGYSWLTHMFTHGDIFHLGGNMIYLFLFGSCVEDLKVPSEIRASV
jgi:membrane associated rhomboid family serine protease